MARKKKICSNCLDIIDKISLELNSLKLVEDSLNKLTEQAIRSPAKFIQIDDIYLEIVSTALYNSINDIKKIIA
ncbi:MAG: hypothetical protein WC476_11075 [Phycisphaerae bacterium]|jgi:hypothetical protein